MYVPTVHGSMLALLQTIVNLTYGQCCAPEGCLQEKIFLRKKF